MDGVTYYSSLEVVNFAGGWAVMNSDGFKVDVRAPYCGLVLDGPSFDLAYVAPHSVAGFVWLGSDKDSGYGWLPVCFKPLGYCPLGCCPLGCCHLALAAPCRTI